MVLLVHHHDDGVKERVAGCAATRCDKGEACALLGVDKIAADKAALVELPGEVGRVGYAQGGGLYAQVARGGRDGGARGVKHLLALLDGSPLRELRMGEVARKPHAGRNDNSPVGPVLPSAGHP